MKKEQASRLSVLMASVAFAGALSLMVPSAWAQSGGAGPARNAEQVPTARYGRGEAIDLSLIIDEWRDRYPTIPVFVCTCNDNTCGDSAVWPFRTFTRYQPIVALGDVNAARNEEKGFDCFDMVSGDRPDD
jgi:hypothetical protein